MKAKNCCKTMEAECNNEPRRWVGGRDNEQGF